MKKISVIIPCYNEQESLPLYFKAVDEVLPKIHDFQMEFVLVNDGSKDDTLNVMKKIHDEREDVRVVNLSRNYGQNSAFSAGLKSCDGDYAIMMDSDLQDPVTSLPDIAVKFLEGYDVVNMHRSDRAKDTAFKRNTAGLFYKLINMLEGKKVIPENVNCFRGISRKVIDEILSLSESDRYLLAEIPLIGFKTTTIDFVREERDAGTSKYSIKKLVDYAFANMSSITSRPLYFPLLAGMFSCLFTGLTSLVFLVLFILSYPGINIIPLFSLYQTLFILSCVFFGLSILLCFIGVLGVYLHNILINTRNRPNYIIESILPPKKD